MKDKISDVMAGRVGAEKLPVQHMRNPGQRMPVAGITRCKGPCDAFECYAGLDVWIFINVNRVVKINKIIGIDLAINCRGDHRQSQTNPKLVIIVELLCHQR